MKKFVAAKSFYYSEIWVVLLRLTICFCGGVKFWGSNFRRDFLGGVKKFFFFWGGGKKISGGGGSKNFGGGGVKFVLNIQFLWRNLWLQKVFYYSEIWVVLLRLTICFCGGVKFWGSNFRRDFFGKKFFGGGSKKKISKNFGGGVKKFRGGGQICVEYSIFMKKFVAAKSFLLFWNLSGSIKRLWFHYITVQLRGCEEMKMMMMMMMMMICRTMEKWQSRPRVERGSLRELTLKWNKREKTLFYACSHQYKREEIFWLFSQPIHFLRKIHGKIPCFGIDLPKT